MATSAEVKMNKSDQNIGIQFDQDQLTQISQLINNLQSQQVSVMNNLSVQNSQASNENFEQLNDVQIQQQSKNFMDTSESLSHNNFDSQKNETEQLFDYSSYQIPNCNFQQVDQQEVHTIILNGQPALFIPASSAMSSNLLCQMMTNQLNTNQFDFSNTEVSLQNQENMQSYQNDTMTQAFNVSNNIDITNTNLNNEHDIFSMVTQNNNNNNNNNNSTNINDIIGNLENLNQSTIPVSSNQEGLTVNQSNDINQGIMCFDKDEKISFQDTFPIEHPQNQSNKSKAKVNSAKKAKKSIPKNTVASALANSSNTKHALKNKKPNKVLKSNETQNIEQAKNITSFYPQSQVPIETEQNMKASPKQNIIQYDESVFMMNCEGSADDLIQKVEKIEMLHNMNGTSYLEEPKLKRKACDCPNCIKWKRHNNEMSAEELSKKRTHNCHKCPKEYNKSSHLRAHLRAHDNYRPYICDFMNCGKSFTRSDELKRHKRIHNDDRNFICQICKKKFLRSDHLNKHLLVHNKSSNSSSNAISLLELNNSMILDSMDMQKQIVESNSQMEPKNEIKLENTE